MRYIDTDKLNSVLDALLEKHRNNEEVVKLVWYCRCIVNNETVAPTELVVSEDAILQIVRDGLEDKSLSKLEILHRLVEKCV